MNPLLLLGALGVGAYILLSQSSSSGASGSYAPSNPYGGGGGAPTPSDGGGYGGPTNLGSGGSSTPLGPAAVTSSSEGGGYGGPVSSSAPAPTYMTDETTARFPNLATGAGQGMSSYGGESEDASGGFPAADMSGTASGPQLRWDPMSRRWY